MYQKILSGLNSKKNKYIAKAISLVEDGDFELFNLFNLDSNNSYRIGITGPPGAGKSSITNELIKYFRKLNKKVGVLLVDPTSPFTSGAVLGDRIRMNEFHKDSFILLIPPFSRRSTTFLPSYKILLLTFDLLSFLLLNTI